MATPLRQSAGLLRLFLERIEKRTGRTTPDHSSPEQQQKREIRRVSFQTRPGLDRRSQTWRDAVGPGYVTGVSQSVIDLMNQDSKT